MTKISWDKFFFNITKTVSKKSPCLSRHVGAILVKDHVVVSVGYNGPARSVPHCGKSRNDSDNYLKNLLKNSIDPIIGGSLICPRKRLGHPIGSDLAICTAVHAEANCIINAARSGVSTKGTTLYVSDQVPCKDCFSSIINAGITEIVCTNLTFYDPITEFIYKHGGVYIRLFNFI